MKFRPSHAIVVFLLAPAAPASAQSEACSLFPTGATEHTCTCGPGPYPGRIWGSGLYTGDSPLCLAAVHAGVIGPEGGEVTARSEGGGDTFIGSTSNGVTSENWNQAHGTVYVFEGAQEMEPLPTCGTLGEAAELNCHCPMGPPVGEIWGSDPYTADSDICTAARQAGIIPSTGGEVTVQRGPGQASYAGRVANGIRSSDQGSTEASFTFVPNE